MRIAIAGPVEIDTLRKSLGLTLAGAPAETRETSLGPLAVELVQRGHDVHVVTHDPDVKESIRISEGGLTLHVLPRRRRARDLALTFFSREIAALKAEFLAIKPDIVHAHWTYEFAEAALRSGLPHLVTMRDSPWKILGFYRDAYRFFRLLMALRSIPRIKALAVVSPYLIRHARLHGYFRHVHVVPNGVFVPFLAPDHNISDRRLNSSIRIVTVGDSGRLKNVQASVAAFVSIQQRISNAELHLFGPGLDGTYTAGAPGVYGHGMVPHASLMQFFTEEAALLIHPSLEESFGVVLAEAMARGIPCIAGRHSGGVPFVLGRELASMLVDVRDSTQIADKAVEVLTNPSEYSRLSEMARNRAQSSLSQHQMAENYLSVYAEILNNLSSGC